MTGFFCITKARTAAEEKVRKIKNRIKKVMSKTPGCTRSDSILIITPAKKIQNNETRVIVACFEIR